MLQKNSKSILSNNKSLRFGLFLTLFLVFPALGFAQTNENSQSAVNTPKIEQNQTALTQTETEKTTAPVLVPVLKSYKEVVIGMPADEVRDKLGKPKIEDNQGYFYQFNEDESVQILMDGDKKVRGISMMYVDRTGNAPKPETIFGADSPVAPNEDGSIYKLVRYPDAGYVVVYSRTAGDSPMVVVTMQKI